MIWQLFGCLLLEVQFFDQTTCRGPVAQLVERPSKGHGSRCSSTDVSLVPGYGKSWYEKNPSSAICCGKRALFGN